MKKIKLLLIPLTTLPLVSVISCENTGNNLSEKPIKKLANSYSIKNSYDLQGIFNDAIIDVPENVSKNMFSSIEAITPQNGFDVKVMRGTISADANYNNDDYLFLLKSNSVTSYTGQQDISYNVLPPHSFNLRAAFDSSLSKEDVLKYAPIRWDWFGANETDFENVTGAFVVTSTANGSSVNIKQIKFEKATTGIVWKQMISYDTTLVGQSKTNDDGDQIPGTVRGSLQLGQYDKYNFNHLTAQLAYNGLTQEERTQIQHKKIERINSANTHLNDLYNEGLSENERHDNKNNVRKFEISPNADKLWFYDGSKKYAVNVDISKFKKDLTTNKTVRTITLNYTGMIDTVNPGNNIGPAIFEKNPQGLPWKISNGGKGFGVSGYYRNAFNYICGFFGIIDSTVQFETTPTEYDGLSLVANLDWIKGD